METELSILVHAPIGEVFDFFDDPRNALAFQEHASSHVMGSEVTDIGADGRRTFEIRMKAGPRTWMQTINQAIREEPTRLLTESWTWTRDRDARISVITTDRRFVADGDTTRIQVRVSHHIVHPWRHPLAVLLNRLVGDSAGKVEVEHAFHFIAEHLEARHRQ